MEKQTLKNLCNRFATPNGLCTLFKGLSAETLEFILSYSIIGHEPEGHTIVHQGDIPKYLYLILTGAVQTIRVTQEGKETPVRLIGPNETFMDAVIFMQTPSPVSARIAEAASILRIPAPLIHKLVAHNGRFALNMLQITSNFYKKAIHQIESVTTKPPIQRVGCYLLNAYLEQVNPGGTAFRLPHRKSAIANHLGMQPETFSRALAQIKKMGVDIEREIINLKDGYSLCVFCDQDAALQCKKFGTPECIAESFLERPQ